MYRREIPGNRRISGSFKTDRACKNNPTNEFQSPIERLDIRRGNGAIGKVKDSQILQRRIRPTLKRKAEAMSNKNRRERRANLRRDFIRYFSW